jgi:hypothetical protein
VKTTSDNRFLCSNASARNFIQALFEGFSDAYKLCAQVRACMSSRLHNVCATTLCEVITVIWKFQVGMHVSFAQRVVFWDLQFNHGFVRVFKQVVNVKEQSGPCFSLPVSAHAGQRFGTLDSCVSESG